MDNESTNSWGGGIFIYNSSPVIQSNNINNNTGTLGGGIYIYSGTPTIGGTSVGDTGNFNDVCSNTPDQINPDNYPYNNINTVCP